MKIDKKTLTYMQADIARVLDKLNVSPANINTTADRLSVWHRVYMCRAYTDDHPAIYCRDDSTRILSYQEDYPMYPCGSNDDSLDTALKYAIKKINQKEAKS